MYKGPFLLKIYILDVLKDHDGQRSLILDLLNEHLDQVIPGFGDFVNSRCFGQ